VDVKAARGVARRMHMGHVSRSGEPLIDHVERVARAVPPDRRALAYLHDVPERADQAAEQFLEHRLSDEEYGILALLTRRHAESYRAYVMRIANASGRTGRVARTIKLADLNDHLGHRHSALSAPDYAWARKQIVAAQREKGEAVSVRNANFRSVG
jgi:hypothetical protein